MTESARETGPRRLRAFYAADPRRGPSRERDLGLTWRSVHGTTYRAGYGKWTLPGGETFELDLAPVDGVLSEHHGVACVDAICEVDHAGMSGFCDLEVSTNPRGGSGPVTAALRAVHTDGVSRREES